MQSTGKWQNLTKKPGVCFNGNNITGNGENAGYSIFPFNKSFNPFRKKKILDSSKQNELADYNIKFNENGRSSQNL